MTNNMKVYLRMMVLSCLVGGLIGVIGVTFDIDERIMGGTVLCAAVGLCIFYYKYWDTGA